MSSIPSFAAGTYLATRSTRNLVDLKGSLEGLTTQLSTGRTADTYGGLGAGRTTSLSARATISALDGYTAAITGAETRVKLATASLTQIATVASTTNTTLNAYLTATTTDGTSLGAALARSSLDAVADALNQTVGDQFIFGGRATDTAPVISTATMLNGDPAKGLVGLKALVAEQTAADLGSLGNGRLTQTQAGGAIRLSEDASAQARANFGFSLLGATSTNGTAITATRTGGQDATVDLALATQPSPGDRVRVALVQADGSQSIVDLTAATSADSTGSFAIGATAAETAANLKAALGTDARIASVQSANPPGLSATFAGGSAATVDLSVQGNPAVGDSVTVTVGLKDGTTQEITLTAAANVTPGSTGSFAIGATPEATTANLSDALSNALKRTAGTALTASSTTRAAQNFFDGSASAGLAPRRVSGDGYAETADPKTVIWYTGDDAASDPRATSTARISAARTVAIGARANEAPIRQVLAGLASLAVSDVIGASGSADTAASQALGTRAQGLLSQSRSAGPSVTEMAGEFAIASSTMGNAKEQAASTKQTLQTAIDGVESVSTEEVTVKLLALQTQLQASYKVTSMLSQLTLVNYMG